MFQENQHKQIICKKDEPEILPAEAIDVCIKLVKQLHSMQVKHR